MLWTTVINKQEQNNGLKSDLLNILFENEMFLYSDEMRTTIPASCARPIN